ncbi:hypothetical protein J2Z40_000828 [Cytobacillus eiseniae]|uniref:DUF3784 domain-containing protein n=1 Tax=Cytobacillus eiseniae TaxID=762947 RepID=A0ABS4RBK4_9BACI|nr:hypothetical protein [Cytobacillus eiseniae]MBP2240275.1 hypothetical protein [Cytobacillus eiseniae]
MAEIILTVICLIPLEALLIWTYFYPEDSILVGKRWMYQEEPEISKSAIRYTKFISLLTIIGLPIFLLSIILDIMILKLSLILFPAVFIIGAMKIFTNEED